MVQAMEIQIFKYEKVSHKSSKQMVCCYRQLFNFTKRSQYYKNNGGIAIGRPYKDIPWSIHCFQVGVVICVVQLVSAQDNCVGWFLFAILVRCLMPPAKLYYFLTHLVNCLLKMQEVHIHLMTCITHLKLIPSNPFDLTRNFLITM